MTAYKPRQTLRFSPDWKATTLAGLLLPCLIMLGFWQLSRADEKEALKILFEQRQAQSPVPLEQLSHNQDLRYQPVSLIGEFDPDIVILLDNKIRKGRFGYEVISLFRLTQKEQWALINRGWIAGDKSRRTLPSIEMPSGVVELQGEVYVPSGKMMTLGAESEANGWPRVLQSLNTDALSSELKREIFPFQIRVDEKSAGAYTNNWVVVNVQPQKHIAYAFQWFAMAMTLIIIVVLANTNLWSLLKGQNTTTSD